METCLQVSQPPCLSADNWFVAQLKPNGLAMARRNLARQRFNVFAPLRRATGMRGGRMVNQLQPLFPGYAFVQFDPRSGAWAKINNTRGITHLIANDPRQPRPMPPEFMAGLIARCDQDESLRPPESFAVGDRIRVVSGPFAQLVTTVEALSNDDRLRILIDLMGQKVKALIESGHVEKLAD